ncbi:unnamed protein product [Anisakis simplex]|uniref:Carboxylesterase type B domain-containing protein n=1 Tax=Anisakis simplex TaxID=6269 RepID=A0A3P6SVW6_ANISI|nr:unnamed protein product [Anisakis simplex]
MYVSYDDDDAVLLLAILDFISCSDHRLHTANLDVSLKKHKIRCFATSPKLQLTLQSKEQRGEQCSTLASAHEDHIPIELKLRSGKIRGTESIFLHRRVRAFLGVPFAEPPIGRQRFRAPTPKQPWNGTVNATRLAPACYQGRDTYNVTFWGSEMWNANTENTEDCLYLNIWAPAEAQYVRCYLFTELAQTNAM